MSDHLLAAPHPRRSRRRVLVAPLLVAVVATSTVAGGFVASAHADPAGSGRPGAAKPVTYSADGAALRLSVLGSYSTGTFDESSAEIIAFHADRLFVVNAREGAVDVLDVSRPSNPTKVASLRSDGVANSVAVRADGLGVVALESVVKTDPGKLVFFDAGAPEPVVLGSVTVGSLPDMVKISADGRRAVVANEGEPSEDFTVDPEGSVSIVDLPATVAAAQQSAVRTATFHAFEEGGTRTLDDDVRVYGPRPHPDRPVSRNLEPEYLTIDGATAYVALQENNAIAEVDLARATVTDIWSLGAKQHSRSHSGLDATDADKAIDIRPRPQLFGLYMPDGIDRYRSGGETYLVTANEGDAREWGTAAAGTEYTEEVRVKDLGTDGTAPVCAGRLDALVRDAGRLKVSRENGLRSDGSCYEKLYAFGGRSFSIWTTDGEQVFDSGDRYEKLVARTVPGAFNTDHVGTAIDGRSDDKGPEPENLTIGTIQGRTYVFVGLERVGGVVVHDITDPEEPELVTYLNNRDFSVDMATSTDVPGDLARVGDLGPEGLTFVPASDSPTGRPMLAVGNEVSGTTTLLDIRVVRR